MGKICLLCRRIQEKLCTRSYHRFPSDHTERVKWFENLEIPPVFTRNIYLCSDHFDPNSFLIRPLGRRVLKKNTRPRNMPSASKDPEFDSVRTSSSEISSEVSAKTVKEVVLITHCKEETAASPLAVSLSSSPLAVPLSSSSATKSATESVADEELSSEHMGLLKERSLDQQLLRKRRKPAHSIVSSTTESLESEKKAHVPNLSNVKKKKKYVRYVGDCLIDDMNITPRKAKRNWRLAKSRIILQSKQIRTLQQQNRRLRTRVKTLLQHLEDNNLK
ncbi:uncharacterized protein LOC123003944 isoform X2 [Tribolium madens]|uniref:uncharacterized protein LOC123003944 isoform X2 n=1 Tax=Tribolium madens TaxID=41895 RepID=UPI001CF71D77|nr:uncharacterized protein LOC123003944 isoform X2 [Tribolium madens]